MSWRMFVGLIIGFFLGMAFLALMVWLGSEERAFSKIAKAELKKAHRVPQLGSPPEGDVFEVSEKRFQTDLRMRL